MADDLTGIFGDPGNQRPRLLPQGIDQIRLRRRFERSQLPARTADESVAASGRMCIEPPIRPTGHPCAADSRSDVQQPAKTTRGVVRLRAVVIHEDPAKTPIAEQRATEVPHILRRRDPR